MFAKHVHWKRRCLYLKGISGGEMGAALEVLVGPNGLPESSQPKAKNALHSIWQAETGAKARQAFDLLITTYDARHPKATLC